jgi:hypothetical protein
MRNWSGVRGRPRAPVSTRKSGFDVTRFAPSSIAHSPPADGRVWGSSGLQGRSLIPRETWLPSRHHRYSLLAGTAARWGEMPEQSSGYGLSSRPPDVRCHARARPLVFEDPRSDRTRTRKASVNTTLLTFDAAFPDTFQSVDPVGCPTGLPLLGLSKDRPSVVLATPKSTPGGPSRVRLRDEPATARPRSVLVVSTTSTACSFDATRVCCNARPTLGFTPFQQRR